MPDVAIGALVGSLIAIILTPISQGLSHYLSQFLSRPVLSIEYIEAVAQPQTLALDTAKLESLTSSQAYTGQLLANQHLMLALASIQRPLSREQASVATARLSSFIDDLQSRISRIPSIERELQRENIPAKIVSIVQSYTGPLFSSLPFASDPPESMKIAFRQHLSSESKSLGDMAKTLRGIVDEIQGMKFPVSDTQFKLSILNKGGTDGLIRSTGTLEFSESQLTVPIVRTSAPKQAGIPAVLGAVQVAVTNQPDNSVTPLSVGKIEKNSMVEFWFVIDENKLQSPQIQQLSRIISNSAKSVRGVVLRDQDNSPIVYVAKVDR